MLMVRLAVLVATTTALSGIPSAWGLDDSDKIYRCDRRTPLFTNKASYGCEEYEPRGLVAVAPNGTMFLGATGMLVDRSTETASVRDGETAQERLCELYDEWVSLNERTAGGFLYQDTRQAARWQALAKIFSAIGVPTKQCRR
jgi:hypothetical protein